MGNITVGGTGKTPHTEYLINLLETDYKLATLSRGYGRKTRGFRQVQQEGTAVEFGDEPMQLKLKHENISVNVCEDRVKGAEIIIKNDKPALILLDDAYQHRHIKPSLSILLIDYNRPIWDDFPFPVGMLRERRSGKKRADIIIISKCGNITEQEREDIIKKLKPENHQQVFFSQMAYKNIKGFTTDIPPLSHSTNILSISGIAQPKPFQDELGKRFSSVEHIQFKDHHNFTEEDIKQITKQLGNIPSPKAIITTEKDYVRLKPFFKEYNLSQHSYFLPIEVSFLFNEEEQFRSIIVKHIQNFKP